MGTMEMAVFKYVRVGAEFWELQKDEGNKPEICTKLQSIIDLAQSLGVEKFKEKLVSEGKY